jgi:hypothetical protein
MKKTKAALRLWLAGISFGGFMGGWVLLAHAPKPAANSSSQSGPQTAIQPLPTLAPLAPLPLIGSGTTASLSSSLPTFSSRAFMPVFRTGGS